MQQKLRKPTFYSNRATCVDVRSGIGCERSRIEIHVLDKNVSM